MEHKLEGLDEVMRQLREKIDRHLLNSSAIDWENFDGIAATLEGASIGQLWRLCRFIDVGDNFHLFAGNPKDHIGIKFAGMYVGIEPDGYSHS